MAGIVREDIQATVSHPVPVPRAPRRPGGMPTLTFEDMRTPVRIRYVPLGKIRTVALSLASGPDASVQAFPMHAGRIWELLVKRDLGGRWGGAGSDWLAGLPLPALPNIRHAYAAARFRPGAADNMFVVSPDHVRSPLRVRQLEKLYQATAVRPPSGTPLADLSGRCRAAVAAFAESSLIHDGEALYMAHPRLALSHAAPLGRTHPHHAIHPADPTFPHEDLEEYLAWIESTHATTIKGADPKAIAAAAAEIAQIHEGPDPVGHAALYANAAATYVADAARGILPLGGDAAIEARRRYLAFWPTLALASVSAIREEDVRPALDAIRSFAAYVGEAHPNAQRRAHMESVASVVWTVMLPRLARAAPVPEADEAAIAGLAP
jgi:hypothetical protein